MIDLAGYMLLQTAKVATDIHALLFCVLIEQLAAIPEFSKLGPLFKSADKPVELTESETEYVVRCIKHTFANHIVFQVRTQW